jgi:hypothetical protein
VWIKRVIQALCVTETRGSRKWITWLNAVTVSSRSRAFMLAMFNMNSQRLRWSGGCVLASSTQVRGFKPIRNRRIFQGEKFPSTPSFGGEVKPAVPCCRFTACKRTLNVTWKSAFRQNSRLLFLAHWSSTSRCLDLSRRVGRGDTWRQQWELLENRVYNKPNGCSATGALAPGPDHQQQQHECSASAGTGYEHVFIKCSRFLYCCAEIENGTFMSVCWNYCRLWQSPY